jgi:hypothetical protein
MTAVVTVNPATGERLAEYPAFSDADVDAALDRAASVQAGWAALSFPDRAAVLHRARKFDVVVAENVFGDILSDLAGELAGSLGIAPSVNASEDRAMAQAAHGSAPDIAGKGLADPIAMILSSGMLLDWPGTRYGDERAASPRTRRSSGRPRPDAGPRHRRTPARPRSPTARRPPRPRRPRAPPCSG